MRPCTSQAFLAAVLLAILTTALPTGCLPGTGPAVEARPPSAVPPTPGRPAGPAPGGPAPTVRLPLTENFDDPRLAGWYPIGRGEAVRTAAGQLLLEETEASLGFCLLYGGVLPDRVAIDFDCQALRFNGHAALVFCASRKGRPFAADPDLADPAKDAELMALQDVDFYMFGWHTGWLAAEFPLGPGETVRTPKAVLQRNPGGAELAAVPDRLVAPDQQTHHVRVEKDGSSIRILVDGALRLAARDPAPLSGGQFGFRIRGDRTGTFRCLIDNLRITPL